MPNTNSKYLKLNLPRSNVEVFNLCTPFSIYRECEAYFAQFRAAETHETMEIIRRLDEHYAAEIKHAACPQHLMMLVPPPYAIESDGTILFDFFSLAARRADGALKRQFDIFDGDTGDLLTNPIDEDDIVSVELSFQVRPLSPTKAVAGLYLRPTDVWVYQRPKRRLPPSKSHFQQF